MGEESGQALRKAMFAQPLAVDHDSAYVLSRVLQDRPINRGVTSFVTA